MPKAQVVKWGNSLAVRIPKGVAQHARMKEGDAVVIKAVPDKIELRRVDRIPTLEELVAQITPENRYEEVDWGPPVGREKVQW
ncbi:MAG TPA: AbrB/MazE/SpoVT family DNA-binding domain-containing protein [Candidatus Dormibacteraeota bacterium]|nr:AbrB/MazE/SpoVT family DNA-binding domain-containing protein [Candidatus Dormibacteraeota bacterium]